MISILKLIYKTVLIYVLLILGVRITGKRQVGELEVSELITTLLVSEIAAIPIADEDISIFNGIIPLLIIILLEIITSFIVSKSRKIKKLIDGVPTVLIDKGTINYENLKKTRITIDELLSELRILGFSDVSKVNYTILESNGKLSAFAKSDPPDQDPGIAHELILDGNLNRSELEKLKISESEIKKQARKSKTDTEGIFLMTVDDQNSYYTVKKSDIMDKNKK